MGSKKDNMRSFRYSDEVAAALEAQPGTSLNDKFERLVLRSVKELPRQEARAARRVEQAQQDVSSLQLQACELRRELTELREAERLRARLEREYESLREITAEYRKRLEGMQGAEKVVE